MCFSLKEVITIRPAYIFLVVLIVAAFGTALMFMEITGAYQSITPIVKTRTTTGKGYMHTRPMPCEGLFGCVDGVEQIGVISEGKSYDCLCDYVLFLRQQGIRKNIDYECLLLEKDIARYEPVDCADLRNIQTIVTPELTKGEMMR